LERKNIVSDKKNSSAPEHVPKVKLVKQAKISLIWIVPIAAAAAAGWLIFNNVRQSGTRITILFADGQGLEAGQTAIRFRGVQVGDVRAIGLTKDGGHVEVVARLNQSADLLARDGSKFWVVRPEVGAGGFHGLETIVSGSYIQVQPGNGAPQKNFTGLEEPPFVKSSEGGIEFIVTTPRTGSLSQGSPVYFRGIEVGAVQYLDLSPDKSLVNVHVHVNKRYESLVRMSSKFWNAGGINMELKLFGIDFSAESLKSLVAGGLAFANPPPVGPPATNDSTFKLYEKPERAWEER
jgi:paraquat-inducible protein B